ncbi:hypothetical protein CONPUDRAFT_161935 [Coniophora puteana RWD-64-598 SS2]|uniref:FAS1 domain-containing protein n=1 Tax=Coniophora puteana (strain RWD-64-598) TaxID=741705 RepID=A0A5M3N970_CONPW|nr:uncharacterized protein CONPUDRAFT_161935 [Coniophora puteana RWD-64-598 SS2]EIW87391.1 hypothetical protein CONPUDRAFT_161935 [Coniophora puteana RWD-64-598 SS2]
MRLGYIFTLCAPLLAAASRSEQKIMAAKPQDILADPFVASQPTITDVLTIQRPGNIFFDYARSLALSESFSNKSKELTVLMPTNTAVMKMDRKPNEPEQPGGDIQITEAEYESQSTENVERWVSAHVIEGRVSLDKLPKSYNTLLSGKTVSFEFSSDTSSTDDWKNVVMKGGKDDYDIKILNRLEAANGVIFVIDGTVSPSS